MPVLPGLDSLARGFIEAVRAEQAAVEGLVWSRARPNQAAHSDQEPILLSRDTAPLKRPGE